MNWIRVRDRFPEENVKVLGLEAHGVAGAEIISVEWSKIRGWHSFNFDLPDDCIITCWCEFPEVPEEWWE